MLQRCFERVQRRLDTVNNVMQENLTGMRLIRVFVRKQHERRRFEQHSSELMNDTVSALRLTETTMPFILFIMNASIIAVLWFGHRDILTGSASVGEVVAIINYSMRTMGALSAFSMIVASFSRARASAGRMDEVLTAEEASKDVTRKEERMHAVTRHEANGQPHAGAEQSEQPHTVAARSEQATAESDVEIAFTPSQKSAPLHAQQPSSTIQTGAIYGETIEKNTISDRSGSAIPSLQNKRDLVVLPGQAAHAAEVELQQVHFRYPDTERPILTDISFVARAGRMTAVMGATGSGKSSLIQLMLRLYDPNAGTIRIDGQDISSLEEHELRSHIGYVPQEIVLFTGTIRENIAWGNEQATIEEIQEAARIAQIHDTIVNLPGGYETRLGQRGVNLSGGQKQRLSIARALVRKPSLLLLDDSTSALDVRTEAKLLEELGRLSCTTVLITQKISSTIRADKVLLLQDGRLIAEGGHDQLLQVSELYRRIYASQFGEEELQHVEGIH